MKKIALSLLVVCLAGSLHAQVLTEWKNPAIAAVAKEYPVMGFMSYTSRENAQTNDYTTSPYYRSLDGIWKHKRFSSALSVGAEVFAVVYNTADWNDVAVPQQPGAPVEMNGQTGIPEDVSADLFRTEFHMPFAWADKQVFVEVGEASSGVSVFVNGEKVGYAEDSSAPAMYDITTVAKEGNNVLVIAATGWSTGAQLEDDSRQAAGIYGNVCIKALPKVRVRDFEIRTDLTDNYRNGALDFGIVVKSHFLNQKEVNIYFELFSPEGELLKTESKPVVLNMRQEQTVHFDVLVPEVRVWSPEDPALYQVMTRVQYEGRYVEYIERKVGFRKIEIQNGQLLFNGRPAELRGTTLADCPDDTAQLNRVFAELKQRNVNAIRLPGGPKNERFYEACDQTGFFLLCEANIDSRSHGTALESTLGNRPAYLNPHMDRVQTLYERTKNYPSVILYSMGNRAGNGYNFYETYLWWKSREPMRPVVYAGAGREWNTDMLILTDSGTQLYEQETIAGNPRPLLVIDEHSAMGIPGGFGGVYGN